VSTHKIVVLRPASAKEQTASFLAAGTKPDIVAESVHIRTQFSDNYEVDTLRLAKVIYHAIWHEQGALIFPHLLWPGSDHLVLRNALRDGIVYRQGAWWPKATIAKATENWEETLMKLIDELPEPPAAVYEYVIDYREALRNS
jgi:hypothetical protein